MTSSLSFSVSNPDELYSALAPLGSAKLCDPSTTFRVEEEEETKQGKKQRFKVTVQYPDEAKARPAITFDHLKSSVVMELQSLNVPSSEHVDINFFEVWNEQPLVFHANPKAFGDQLKKDMVGDTGPTPRFPDTFAFPDEFYEASYPEQSTQYIQDKALCKSAQKMSLYLRMQGLYTRERLAAYELLLLEQKHGLWTETSFLETARELMRRERSTA